MLRLWTPDCTAIAFSAQLPIVSSMRRRTQTQAWLLRALSTENALCITDLERLSGWAPRTLRKGLSELVAEGLVVRFANEDPDHGSLPAVWMRAHDDALMRVSDHVLRERATPKMATEDQRVMRLRTAYIARVIRARKERERRKADDALRRASAEVG